MSTDHKNNDDELRLKNTSESIEALDAESLLEMLQAAYELQEALRSPEESAAMDEVEKLKPMMLVLLEYLALNEDNPNLDPAIFEFLDRLFGKELKIKKDKEKEEEEEEKEVGEDDQLSAEEKKRRARMYMYEVYKITNPNRIAGETDLQNFIKNVKTRGLSVAVKYEGESHVKDFSSKEIKNMESYRDIVRQSVKDSGSRGGGIW